MELALNQYKAALYMRLSKDDSKTNESSSITTQRKMLVSYAKDNSFFVYDEYIDDGFSGTNFERPNFKRMIKDIENKKINLVITKDLSRLGRNYIKTGEYTEIFFPSKGVRYIAINDGYDSENIYADIVPFKNIINEMYARDTSKKIRSAFITKMKDGSYIGNFAPYGYIKDSKNKNHLLIDINVSQIVKKIFYLAVENYTPSQIAKYLNENKIPTPSMYRCSNHQNLNIDNYSKRKQWTTGTISKMLKNTTYLGHTVQGKTTKISFKSKVTIQNPKDNWIIVNNTHEPIVNEETFDIVNRKCKSRTCTKKCKFYNIFSGIAKCMDCGKNMSSVGSRKKNSLSNLSCGAYKLYGKNECSNHFIDYNLLYNIVLNILHELSNLTEYDKKEIILELQKELINSNDESNQKKEIESLNTRNNEIVNIIKKLYEDNFKGIISNENFNKLILQYEYENKEIMSKLKIISESKNKINDTKKSYEYFYNIVRDYVNIQSLNKNLLYKLIDHIEVGQGYFEKKDTGKIKYQTIKIYVRFAVDTIIKEYSFP